MAAGDVLGTAVQDATELAIEAARGHLTAMDAGAVETLRALARKIDTEQELRDRALDYAEAHESKPPSVDNVSIPTYLKYCDALGLTPVGRKSLGAKEKAPGKLAAVRSISPA